MMLNKTLTSSNIYNTYQLIRNTSELGISLFRKYSNQYYLKSLTAGQGIKITESDSYINISTVSNSEFSKRNLMISGVTSDKPIVTFRSSTPIYLKIIGQIGEDNINCYSVDTNFIGIHTHDENFTLTSSDEDGLAISHDSENIYFNLIIDAYSVDNDMNHSTTHTQKVIF